MKKKNNLNIYNQKEYGPFEYLVYDIQLQDEIVNYFSFINNPIRGVDPCGGIGYSRIVLHLNEEKLKDLLEFCDLIGINTKIIKIDRKQHSTFLKQASREAVRRFFR